MTEPLNSPNRDLWEKPWLDPLENEAWFAKFHCYLELGPDRSLDGAYRKWLKDQPHKSSDQDKKLRVTKAWRTASKNFQWELRAKAYDAWVNEEKQKIRRKLEQEELQKWEERARTLRDRKWELSEELNKLCRRGFLYPLDQQIINQTDDGKQVVVVQPSKWTFRDMVAAAEASADLGDRALGKPDVDLITAIEVVIAEKIFPDEVNTLLLEALEGGFEQWRDRIRSAIKGTAKELSNSSFSGESPNESEAV